MWFSQLPGETCIRADSCLHPRMKSWAPKSHHRKKNLQDRNLQRMTLAHLGSSGSVLLLLYCGKRTSPPCWVQPFHFFSWFTQYRASGAYINVLLAWGGGEKEKGNSSCQQSVRLGTSHLTEQSSGQLQQCPGCSSDNEWWDCPQAQDYFLFLKRTGREGPWTVTKVPLVNH